jgi:survival of motor neuron-related-splicing factor 30
MQLINMASIAEQIQEYEAQLSDVDSLLQESFDDASLISLRTDLIDLINITRQQQQVEPASADTRSTIQGSIEILSDTTATAPSMSMFDLALHAAVGKSVGREEEEAVNNSITENTISFVDTIIEASNDADQSTVPHTIETTDGIHSTKKKAKSFKAEFEVPQHLIPLETDTEGERNKKQRALKALKSKWRESKKEMESTNKQKSWQSFQKKAKTKSTSIFKTGDSAVGVVSAAGRQLTDFASRKRHKRELT